jgi:molybdopterin-containing oxidoreductase family membrane subunit
VATASGVHAPAPRHLPGDELRPAWLDGWPTLRQISDDIARPLSGRPGAAWLACTAASLGALAVGVACVTYQIATGIGVWGLNKSVGWAFDITNFVFWIGIGHAGTLISAILLLFRQHWRMSINRSAEAMTIFAVICAALFPLIHMGRPWLAFWVVPYPNGRGPLWVNFRSPLLWDVFAINTYLTISVVFWYLGMIPDFATLRDRAGGRVKRWVYGTLSLGWNGSQRTWSRYETACLVLAGLATPLVLSVHSIVSMDFATSFLPGWHTTIFPPYFVAGAVFSGFGMVMLLLILARSVMNLQRYITLDHLDRMAKITLFTGSIVAFSYATEWFTAWYSSNPDERFVFVNRATGPYAWAFWTMVTCNVVVPQLLWWRRVRVSPAALLVIAVLINVGMWFERFVIIVTSLHRSYLPSSWVMYAPTVIEVGTLIGSFGLFFSCFLFFIRLLPMIATWEVKGLAGARPPAALGTGPLHAARSGPLGGGSGVA